MKGSSQSRGSAASNSADHSIDCFNETIGTTDTEGFNGSSIETIDPTDNSYFIQYHPEVAEKLSKHKSTYSVSGRCLSIVMSRMIYWSRFAKHRYNGKLFYWKNQNELAQETSFSVKQINRALKVLVELGLLVREKFQKHRYFQCYFYHIPSSPHTKELQHPPRTTSSSSRSTRSISNSSGGTTTQQQFHSRSGGGVARPEAVVVRSSASGAPATTTGGSGGFPPPVRRNNAAKRSSSINRGKGFGSIGTDCPIHNNKNSSSIKHTLLSIVQKCEMYGREDIHKEVFGFNC